MLYALWLRKSGLLTAIDYIFEIHVEHDDVQFGSEVCSNCW